MPRIVDYAIVLQTAGAAGLRCAYPNGAAFVLSPEGLAHTGPLLEQVAAWSAAEDATIRPEMRPRVRQIPPDRLPGLAVRAWREHFPAAEALLAPVHHWAAELQHGDGEWLSPLLEELGIDPAALREATQAHALAFAADEAEAFKGAIATMLARLWKSDFTLLLPGEPVVCTIHHHRQLWWQCVSPDMAETLLTMGS